MPGPRRSRREEKTVRRIELWIGLLGLCFVAVTPCPAQETSVEAPPPSVEGGAFPAGWADLEADCGHRRPWRIHEYNPRFFILRQSGCTHFEKPFLYLLIGANEALLVDTGAPGADVRNPVNAILRRATPGPGPLMPLLVIHSHGHGDHTAGDALLQSRPNTRLVAASVSALTQFFGITNWPLGTATYDLGNRIVDIIPIPGHETAHIAVYDRRTGILLTGDTLYPGRLYVSNQQAYRDSIDRLAGFTQALPVAHVLGAHIEQTRRPFLDYPVGTPFQPEEHVLELGRSHLLELQDALRQMPILQRTWLRDFTIWP
jgi:glyoxylase-like metal-dependent hydrolase (beta-lactamase superfamily II)